MARNFGLRPEQRNAGRSVGLALTVAAAIVVGAFLGAAVHGHRTLRVGWLATCNAGPNCQVAAPVMAGMEPNHQIAVIRP
jgi:hypothetical protein